MSESTKMQPSGCFYSRCYKIEGWLKMQISAAIKMNFQSLWCRIINIDITDSLEFSFINDNDNIHFTESSIHTSSYQNLLIGNLLGLQSNQLWVYRFYSTSFLVKLIWRLFIINDYKHNNNNNNNVLYVKPVLFYG